ncbi:hypothetical protein [Xanthomonas oryzae]|uniref:hypothetical protein n=1 Tax=Xanthomonas oryzae TaxID=347 RepID=UPI0015EF51EE|nr:hypothetical protein [Xanthomonas oryzae]
MPALQQFYFLITRHVLPRLRSFEAYKNAGLAAARRKSKQPEATAVSIAPLRAK